MRTYLCTWVFAYVFDGVCVNVNHLFLCYNDCQYDNIASVCAFPRVHDSILIVHSVFSAQNEDGNH